MRLLSEIEFMTKLLSATPWLHIAIMEPRAQEMQPPGCKKNLLITQPRHFLECRAARFHHPTAPPV
jgi:hypothetical protein